VVVVLVVVVLVVVVVAASVVGAARRMKTRAQYIVLAKHLERLVVRLDSWAATSSL